MHLFAGLTVLIKPVAIAAGLALFGIPSAATAALVTFDFEEFAIGGYYGDCIGCAYRDGALVSNGFVLDPGAADWSPDAQDWIGHYHITDGITESEFVDGYNGTKYFGFDYFGDNSRLNIYAIAGDVFGMRQFDLTEGRWGGSVCTDAPPPFDSACEVTFIGYLAGGGTISQVIKLNGIHDGVGPLTDFETFTFDGRWNRLTMFSIVSADDFLNPGLDNLVLRTVPEPSGLALLAFGLAGIAFRRRRKR